MPVIAVGIPPCFIQHLYRYLCVSAPGCQPWLFNCAMPGLYLRCAAHHPVYR